MAEEQELQAERAYRSSPLLDPTDFGVWGLRFRILGLRFRVWV